MNTCGICSNLLPESGVCQFCKPAEPVVYEPCAKCKKEVRSIDTVIKNTRHFCSMDCAQSYKESFFNPAPPQQNPSFAVCTNCKKALNFSQPVVRDGNKFCGLECSGAYMKKNFENGESPPTNEPPKPELTEEQKIANGCGLGCLGLILLVFIVTMCSPDSNKSSNSGSSSQSQTQTKQWYEGGTLHKSDDAAWLNASESNRLATASDFVASQKEALGLTTLDEVKPWAIKMSACITEASKAKAGQQVSSLAATCLLLMK
jgi:hypothetical protein